MKEEIFFLLLLFLFYLFVLFQTSNDEASMLHKANADVPFLLLQVGMPITPAMQTIRRQKMWKRSLPPAIALHNLSKTTLGGMSTGVIHHRATTTTTTQVDSSWRGGGFIEKRWELPTEVIISDEKEACPLFLLRNCCVYIDDAYCFFFCLSPFGTTLTTLFGVILAWPLRTTTTMSAGFFLSLHFGGERKRNKQKRNVPRVI